MTSNDNMSLSPLTKVLVSSIAKVTKSDQPLEGDAYEVSQTASFFGFMYEKIRNSIEFNEEHLIRKYAIVRILKRRLAINPSGKREGENLVRELLWGKYLDDRSISHNDVKKIEEIIRMYIEFWQMVKSYHVKLASKGSYGTTILNMLASEIEEALSPDSTHRNSDYLYYFYQTLKDRIKLEGVSEAQKDMYFYVAAEKAFAKNDPAFITYNMFTLRYGPLHKNSEEDRKSLARDFNVFMKEAQSVLHNPFSDKLVRFAAKQLPPYKILYSILETTNDPKSLESTNTLQKEVADVCAQKYLQTNEKLRAAAVRSIIYIFATKMIFVLLVEVPVSTLLFNELDVFPLSMNVIIPPLLMGIIVTFISAPSSKNTERIYQRIAELIYAPDESDKIVTLSNKSKIRRPELLFIFTILYLATFSVVFGGIYYVLNLLNFNIISKVIFFFFISIVTFFGYRIRQTAKEYVLETESNILMPAITFLFLPILYVGKLLSSQISKINILILFFDTLIEAPFKFLIDVVEEWISFIKARKDELV